LTARLGSGNFSFRAENKNKISSHKRNIELASKGKSVDKPNSLLNLFAYDLRVFFKTLPSFPPSPGEKHLDSLASCGLFLWRRFLFQFASTFLLFLENFLRRQPFFFSSGISFSNFFVLFIPDLICLQLICPFCTVRDYNLPGLGLGCLGLGYESELGFGVSFEKVNCLLVAFY